WFVFFFSSRRRHTRSKRDWSSDVCSSDLGEHYEVSIKAGERVLLPAVRDADEETLIIADGFSCREQIEQLTDRKGLHLAEVLQMALNKSAEHKEQEAGE